MDDGSGRTYWFHQETRQSRWAKPDAAVVEKLEARLQAERVAKQQRLALRRAEMQEQEQRQQAAAHEAEAVRHDVQGCVASWARGKAPTSRFFLCVTDHRSRLLPLMRRS